MPMMEIRNSSLIETEGDQNLTLRDDLLTSILAGRLREPLTILKFVPSMLGTSTGTNQRWRASSLTPLQLLPLAPGRLQGGTSRGRRPHRSLAGRCTNRCVTKPAVAIGNVKKWLNNGDLRWFEDVPWCLWCLINSWSWNVWLIYGWWWFIMRNAQQRRIIVNGQPRVSVMVRTRAAPTPGGAGDGVVGGNEHSCGSSS